MVSLYLTGIDIGSTTAKVVICDDDGRILFSRYRRHQARTIEAVREIFKEAFEELGDVELDLAVTGSAGLGAAEVFQLPFVQEVIASARFIEKRFPETGTFIEIGGEDSKIIFFDGQFRPDIRMNGSCAGGTGAFIDQMAVLLDVEVSEMNALAENSIALYPFASRCGVFAKTDIQALLSCNASREDVAASIFQAVAVQVVTALSRGREIKKKILFGGGPLAFYPELSKAFAGVLGVDNPEDTIISDHSELIPALGAAMVRNGKPCRKRLSYFLSLSDKSGGLQSGSTTKRLPPLFAGKKEFDIWRKKHEQNRVRRIDLSEAGDTGLFLARVS